MGACLSREDLSEVEQAITAKEHDLLFNQQSAQHIDFILRKYSHNSTMNDAQLNDAAKHLGLPLKNTQTNTKIEAFYSALKTTPASLHKNLLVVGILLGSGSNSSKAKLLFEVYDVDGSHSLSKDKVVTLATEIAEVAIKKLTIVATAEKSEGPIPVYIHNCELRRRDAEVKLVEKIIGAQPSITLEKFILAFEGEELQRLLTSHGVRNFFSKVYAANPSKFNMRELAQKKPADQQKTVLAADQSGTQVSVEKSSAQPAQSSVKDSSAPAAKK